MNKSSTKRSLLASVMALVLCVAMLVGTTFAWFTDSASTGVNKIVSGNLDVGLQMMKNGSWVDAEGETLSWVKAANHEGETVLWEPGCTYELPRLRVVNYGNLALKYELRITGITGDAKLLDALEFFVDGQPFSGADGAYTGSLAAGSKANPTASDALTVSGKMRTDAGNEYQGLSIDGIAVTVYATQDTVESDSFGSTYDQGAFAALAELYPVSTTVSVNKSGATVVDMDQFKMTVPAAAVAENATGITVTVSKSADVNAKFTAPAAGNVLQQFDVTVSGLKPDNTAAVEVQMFIGKGYSFDENRVAVQHLKADGTVETLNGTYDTDTGFVTFTSTSFSPFAVEVPDMAAASGKGLNTCFYADLSTAFDGAEPNSTVVLLKDVSAAEKVNVPKEKTLTLDLNGKTFTTAAKIGIDVLNNAALTVQNGTVKSTNEKTGSYAIKIEKDASLTVNSGKIIVTNSNCTCVSNNGTLTVNGGELRNAGSEGGRWLYVAFTGKTMSITGGTFIGTADVKDGQTNFSITGGTFSENSLSEYCSDGYTLIPNDSGMYVCGKGAPTGYTEDGNNITISGPEALRYVATRVNRYGDSYAGKTVTLANDIDLTGENWEPIGYYDENGSRAFRGTFDGAGHKVTGMTVVSSGKKGVGFFGKADSATVKNLTVEGKIDANAVSYVGGIIGHGSGTVENCAFKGSIQGSCVQVGGIVGSGSFTVTGCKVDGKISGTTWVGGIVGNLQKDSGAYTNCTVTGTVAASMSESESNIFAGGIAAAVNDAAQVITGCYCDATVTVAGTPVNNPIIDSYNGLGITAATTLHIDGNSWNLEKNSDTSFPVRDSGQAVSGRTIARVELSK